MFSLAISAQASIRCEDDAWTKEPSVDDGMYTAEVLSVCYVTGEQGGGLAQLDQYMLSAIVAEEVLGGPFTEVFSGMPGIRYDVRSTRVVADLLGVGTDTLTVRADARVSTDRSTRLVQEAVSTQITGTGNFKYLRKVDYGVRAAPIGQNGGVGSEYRLEIWNVLHVKKPALLPAGYFRDKVTESMLAEFRKSRDARLPQIAANL